MRSSAQSWCSQFWHFCFLEGYLLWSRNIRQAKFRGIIAVWGRVLPLIRAESKREDLLDNNIRQAP